MKTALELTGQKFGRLTAIERDGVDEYKAALWLCRCDCGAYVITRGKRLRAGKVKSCGCLAAQLASCRARKRARSAEWLD